MKKKIIKYLLILIGYGLFAIFGMGLIYTVGFHIIPFIAGVSLGALNLGKDASFYNLIGLWFFPVLFFVMILIFGLIAFIKKIHQMFCEKIIKKIMKDGEK